MECEDDVGCLFNQEVDWRRHYEKTHKNALLRITSDITGNSLHTSMEDGEEVLCPKTYRLNYGCECDGMPTCQVSTHKVYNPHTLRDKLDPMVMYINLNNPFDENSPMYFDCKYGGPPDSTRFSRQVVASLTHHLFEVMKQYRCLESDLHQYPILLARKCCHAMLLSHRHGNSPLSQLPKDVLRYMLQHAWRTRYDINAWSH